MQADSKLVSSNQHRVHNKLPALVNRHLSSSHRRPAAAHSHQSFGQLQQALAECPRPLVLDSFCGTGHSTIELARRHRAHLVVGIDKSRDRLDRSPEGSADNVLLLQADCGDIWRLLLDAGMAVDFHYMFYPNPWPKSGQIQRRVHGGPDFPALLNLGGRVELRSNWQIYVEEFAVAMHLAGHRGKVLQIQPDAPISLFERKYQASAHQLWGYVGQINRGHQTP